MTLWPFGKISFVGLHCCYWVPLGNCQSFKANPWDVAGMRVIALKQCFSNSVWQRISSYFQSVISLYFVKCNQNNLKCNKKQYTQNSSPIFFLLDSRDINLCGQVALNSYKRSLSILYLSHCWTVTIRLPMWASLWVAISQRTVRNPNSHFHTIFFPKNSKDSHQSRGLYGPAGLRPQLMVVEPLVWSGCRVGSWEATRESYFVQAAGHSLSWEFTQG